jgi:dethiobiotin synthetase
VSYHSHATNLNLEVALQVTKGCSFHILGTDTDVGKTWVTTLCLEILSSLGRKPLPLKPVHSGWPTGSECGPDLAEVRQYLGALDPKRCCAYAFAAAMSPLTAGQLEGRNIELKVLQRFWEQRFNLPGDVFVVEGIGGICCPLAPKLSYLDWLSQARAPVVLVSRVGLGSLSQAIMSTRLLQSAGLEVQAIVLNEERVFAPDDAIANSCQSELLQMVDVPVLGPLKRNDIAQNRAVLEPLMASLLA